ncbi:MAG: hypothetical protein H6654_10750 [Ardenticatenaceae bacterium]|nr:hypothetical protein [Anaerolineales bacterium]MCB8938790.1 hypothetical protein [Ardenticatenaceae bacterium]MCB8974026.1 hypothetical protein [Ardenticatenaceae bacterium]
MKQFSFRTLVRAFFALAILLAGVAMVPYVERPAAALEWRMLAGVYAPELSVHADEGAPGSAFAFTGSGFPAHKPATLFVNGRYLGRVMTDEHGMAQFVVQSPASDMALGHYDITMEVDMNASATQGFWLSSNAPLVWAPDGFAGPVFGFGLRLPQ